jgi:hypothetical protein
MVRHSSADIVLQFIGIQSRVRSFVAAFNILNNRDHSLNWQARRAKAIP